MLNIYVMEKDIIIQKSDYIYVHREGLYVMKEEIRELEKLFGGTP